MKKTKIIMSAFTIMATLILTNCVQNTKKQTETTKAKDTQIYKDGLAILEQNCIACHTPHEKGMGNRIAPPLFAMKQHYLETSKKESEFVNNMTSFLLNPTIEHTKMPRAVQKFGIMPNLGMPKENYEAVATYLFRSELEKPDWFENHYQKEKAELLKQEKAVNQDYLKKGMNIALGTKAVLGKNLLTAIKTKGTDKAVNFCNERAIPLTDSMAIKLNAKIRRVSDKNRNINNLANKAELEYINLAKADLKKNGKASPKLQEIDNKMVGYYPITTNNMCLQCHGDPKTNINKETLKTINLKYPEDNAIGYTANELRGIWVITMDNI